MTGIFLSYRRDDAAGHAGRLFDALRARFGHGHVFMDVSSIGAGSDFVETIERQIGSCEVLIAFIGRAWLSDASGRQRLDDEGDFVRLEIASALKRGVRVIPVLVQGATMPQANEVPEDLKPLVRCQAVELRDSRWDADVQDLIASMARPWNHRWRKFAWALVPLGMLVAVALVLWYLNPEPLSLLRVHYEPPSFRRVYYEQFDYEKGQALPAATSEIWPPGRHADWETSIANGVLKLCNVSDSPGASFTNRLGYYEAKGQPFDQSDSKVTARVRLVKSAAGTRGAGIMFRKSPAEEGYYAFLATPGDAVMLYLNTGKALRELWAGDSIPPGPDGFYTLKVVGRGSTLELYADDRLVHTEGGVTLLHGDPGVMAFGLGCFELDDIAVFLPSTTSVSH
jgi:hypothetical protein